MQLKECIILIKVQTIHLNYLESKALVYTISHCNFVCSEWAHTHTQNQNVAVTVLFQSCRDGLSRRKGKEQAAAEAELFARFTQKLFRSPMAPSDLETSQQSNMCPHQRSRGPTAFPVTAWSV